MRTPGSPKVTVPATGRSRSECLTRATPIAKRWFGPDATVKVVDEDVAVHMNRDQAGEITSFHFEADFTFEEQL